MFTRLPELPGRRLALRLTPDALRQVRGGHPWVYAEAITSNSDPKAPSGSLAVIFDKDRAFAAIGLWDPTSPIRVRILHAGKPRKVDGDFWLELVERASRNRRSLERSGTTGYRLLHGENDGTGGLVVDRYGTTLVCKLYSACWLPHLEAVVDALTTVVEPERIVLRLGRIAAADPAIRAAGLTDGMTIVGDVSSELVAFTENGLVFEADVVRGQKTGHFLDQRENRHFIRSVAEGSAMLDVFSCTGGFSVHAAAGGARSVHSVDIAAPAIEAARRNMALNRSLVGRTKHSTTVGDAFEVMDRMGHDNQLFDIVVIDPPSFASRATERDAAMRAYRKLAELGLPLVRPGGRLLQASCSSRVSEDDLVSTVRAALRSQGRVLHEEVVTGHALDHPVGFSQGRYLKAITGIVGA